jgi:hypothetical protein
MHAGMGYGNDDNSVVPPPTPPRTRHGSDHLHALVELPSTDHVTGRCSTATA